MRSTQIEKIIRHMLRSRNVQQWFYAPDFQKPGMSEDTFVGYEATARMSDLMRDYPELVEHKREGKYRYLRFRLENVNSILQSPNVPEDMKNVIKMELGYFRPAAR